ncbi:MAG: cell division protein FtsZ [Thiobacillus sp.]|uniref:cell division protein FtsZ n=1 Tax=unclassified Thiobacillus TaxID=2646513 RepID=UPI0008690EAA|nr:MULTISPECIES: cell division protein FtsZ [unclassified Thiobacillus]MBS0310407.1 cell division protein FtsZ [Pseudomonadota bacterium]MBN8779272.1 cell division protein FtsZ [Thiobacillus sp.]MBS0328902.1 cell division protein FtsZ [Pseudomonadota bacterium]ODV00588.1 MAG: cell division protein FtsZ [Thiobacillus sp. SCN 63-57]OJY55081.1 MAG: cell division protein FtsZ [Thiobacillus sp. 0-1251]
MFELMDVDTQDAVIKVIGVGGCGGNAVDHMISSGLNGVEFIAINTDAQALKRNQAKLQLQLGNGVTKGLGAGANPDVGREAALEDRERIAELIDGADMLFITAGMGGGTGTGAAPVVAEVAKELGILTVAVVTKPFMFEGKRVRAANAGIEALSRHVDSLIIIPNEKLMQVLGDDVSMLDAFKAANNVLHGAVGGIAEVINCPGLVNVDFADVRTVMSEMGMAMMGSAQASGENRARIAAEQAVASPLLEDVNLAGARGVLVNITASSTVKMKEIHEVMNTIKGFTAEEATVIVGQVLDDTMEDALRVTMVATGLGNPVARQNQKPMQIIRTGTDDAPMMVNGNSEELPSVMTSRRSRTIQAMTDSGIDTLDIPAFLRRQAD